MPKLRQIEMQCLQRNLRAKNALTDYKLLFGPNFLSSQLQVCLHYGSFINHESLALLSKHHSTSVILLGRPRLISSEIS